jgi:hypothetical protein
MKDGSLMITFEVDEPDHSSPPGPVNRVVAGRIALPVPAAQRLALSLYDFLKQRGLDPACRALTPDDLSKPQ